MNKDELRSINVTAYKSITTSNTQIGDDIPSDKVRHVWRILATADDGSEQNITIYLGDSSSPTRSTVSKIRIPDTTQAPILDIGGDITNPILTLRPQKSGTTETYNQIYAVAETSAINLTIDYYDE